MIINTQQPVVDCQWLIVNGVVDDYLWLDSYYQPYQLMVCIGYHWLTVVNGYE